MGRILVFLYGLIAYVVFFAAFLYAVGFVGNVFVPKAIDSGGGTFSLPALAVDAAVLGLFAVQHSVMARQGFKRWWTKIIPAPIERSTYVLLASLCLLLLFWQWRPMSERVWEAQAASGRLILQVLFGVGWLVVLLSTFMIDHFDLFGLRQVYLHFRGKEYTPVGFKTPLLYKFLRHPVMFGFVIAFWAAPKMTLGHLIFALATTGYILFAIHLEERDLIEFHGDAYRQYRERTSMLLPMPPRRKGDAMDSLP